MRSIVSSHRKKIIKYCLLCKYNFRGELLLQSLIIFPALIIMQMTIGIYGCIQARDTDQEMLTGIQKQMRREYKEIHKKYSESLNVIQKNVSIDRYFCIQ